MIYGQARREKFPVFSDAWEIHEKNPPPPPPSPPLPLLPNKLEHTDNNGGCRRK